MRCGPKGHLDCLNRLGRIRFFRSYWVCRQIKRVFFCDKTTSLKFFLGHAWLILRNRTLTGAQENKQRYDQAFFRRVIQLLSIVIRMNFYHCLRPKRVRALISAPCLCERYRYDNKQRPRMRYVAGGTPRCWAPKSVRSAATDRDRKR